jgi:hypothetical protein
MSEQRPRRLIAAPIWGIFLLFLGIIFLLQTLDVLPWNLWGTLWRFWPVLIIIIGLGILLRRYNIWLVSLLIAVIFGGCLGIAIWQHGPSLPADVTTESYTVPLDDMALAEINIDFTAGSITIASLPPGSLNFVEADYAVRDRRATMDVDFEKHEGEGKLDLTTINQRFWGDVAIVWTVNLSGKIPLFFNINLSASNAEFDLSQLKVAGIDLEVDAGNCQVTMPSSAGYSYVNIDSDAANMEITVPDGVAAKIHIDASVSVSDVDTSRFPRQGDYYISPDFETAENRIEMEIECDVGRLEVR